MTAPPESRLKQAGTWETGLVAASCHVRIAAITRCNWAGRLALDEVAKSLQEALEGNASTLADGSVRIGGYICMKMYLNK